MNLTKEKRPPGRPMGSPKKRGQRPQGRYRGASGLRTIVVGLDDDTFETVCSMAEAADTSFAEQVRMLIEWGLEAAA